MQKAYASLSSLSAYQQKKRYKITLQSIYLSIGINVCFAAMMADGLL